MDIIKDYSKKLTSLKPLLGSKFHKRIAQMLGIDDVWKVRDAFNGKRSDLSFLKQVYQQAAKLAATEPKRPTEDQKRGKDPDSQGEESSIGFFLYSLL